MARPELVSDSYERDQEARTMHGQFNQNRVQVKNKNLAANDNLPLAANDNDYPDEAFYPVSNSEEEQSFASPNNKTSVKYRKRKRTKLKKPKVSKKISAKKGFAYSRVTAVNISIISWGMALWLAQLVFGLISTATVGALGLYDYVERNSGGISILGEAFTSIASAFLKLLGIDFRPEGIAFAALSLPFFIGVATLLIMSIQYQLARINSFTGEKAEYKMNAFIFALFGYFVPILNLFPWFIFWALAVWRYPK